MKLSIAPAMLDKLLQSMYPLPHRRVLHLQDKESCKQFVGLVEACINAEFQQDESSNPKGSPKGFSPDEVCAIDKAITMLKTTLGIVWLPDYASAIIVHDANHQLPGTVNIMIIGLDSHSFFMHHDDADGYLHESDALDYKILMAGTTEVEKVQAFWARFKEILTRARKRKGDKRSAAGGTQGHQFTPALIHAVATQSISCSCEENEECSCEERVPKGGFTDVGLHTGGLPRNTSYALVKFALEWSLAQGGHVDKLLFRKLFLLVHLRILADRVHRVQEDSKDAKAEKAWKARADLDVAFRILEVISIEGSHLHEKGISILFFFERARDLRNMMDSIVTQLGRTEAKRFILPDVDRLLDDADAFRSPTLHIPPYVTVTSTYRDYEDRIQRNVGPNTLFHKRTHFDLTGLLDWLKSSHFKGKRDHTTVLLRLRTVEGVFWSRARKGLDKENLTSADVERLLSVVNEYRAVFRLFETDLDKGDLMMSELRSRELLIVWISYCLTFAAAKSADSKLMSTVGVALRYEDLEHLVLSDRESWEVVIEVASFLRHHYISEQSELFSLRAPDATFLFAENFSRKDKAIMSIWRAEQNDAQCRVDAYWRVVQKKKDEAMRLRHEIAALEAELASAESHLVDLYSLNESNWSRYDHPDLIDCRNKVDGLKQKINSIRWNLNTARQAPQAVCQPLPKGESSSLRWLFFLLMPETYRVLSTFSFTGQQMLIPRPWNAELDGPDGTTSIDVSTPLLVKAGDCLTSFYGENQLYTFHSPIEGRQGIRGDVGLVFATSLEKVRPNTIGPPCIDLISSKEDGVWYPDCVPYKMEWTGGTLSWDRCSNRAFDPFKVPRKWVVSFFTEKLEAEGKSLQWAMRLDENSDAAYERGNRALAFQETRPQWLSKTEFLTFCNMRGFPSKQLRNVAIALLDRSLPLELAPVQSLLKQTIFHIGPLHTDRKGDLSLGWKEDLTNGELLDTTKAILKKLIEEIKDSPSSYSSALVVCDIAGFMSDWDSDFKTISRRLAESAFRWAEGYGQEAESAERPSDSINFRVHQRLRLSLSILCLTHGPMSDDDVRLTVKCIALGRNVCLDEDVSSTSLRIQLSRIETRCASSIAGRMDTMLKVVKNNLSSLSDAIRAVITVVPDNLSWAERGPSSSSFEANGSDGCSYVINVLTGVILVNGHPPSSLPCEILEHELYQRSFGGRNFEVVCKNEVYETCRTIGGFVYSFALHHKGRLRITERSQTGGELLELLDGVNSTLWAAQLPVRLQEMHSHWLSRDKSTIILRGTVFFDRDVSFIIRPVRSSSKKDVMVGNCLIVPDHLKSNGFRDITESSPSFPRLVLHDSDLLSIFAKFEERRFVHFIVDGAESSSRILSVSLPRYGITFSYREGWFHCVEISGFALSKCQQLGGTLFGFEQYLVVEQSCKQFEKPLTCIIVPDGGIFRARLEGSTIVQPAVACDAIVRWHTYDVHPRFQTLQAGTVASRLYLAALHASTSFISADCDSFLTGFEMAIELVRRCWVARVFSIEEKRGMLKASSACKGRHPALSLLCSEVLQSSQSVSFLYTGTDTAELAPPEWKCRPDEAAKYLNDLECGLLDSRNRLTPIEELRVLGQYGRVPESQTVYPTRGGQSPPVEKDIGKRMEEYLIYGKRMEEYLSQLRNAPEPRPIEPPQREFPLRVGLNGALEKDIFEELRFSWNTHLKITSRDEQLGTANINTRCADLLDRIMLLRKVIEDSRKLLEDYIIQTLNDEMDNATPNSLDLKRLSRLHPRAVASDLLRATLRRDAAKTFNISLRDEDKEKLPMFMVEWLRLCVLEDKFERLAKLSQENDYVGLQNELRIVRNWDPSQYPAWLVFEVEHRLQIWPEQATVARHLIKNSGDIVQLNMGKGKTRVIIPLLVLHWAFHCDDGDSIPRVNILPSLLSEACDFFHRRLTASVFHLKLVMLPFSRDVELDGRRILAMRSLVSWCREHSGFVIVAPEHRLSLELKMKELELGQMNNLAKEVRTFLEESRWVDILDESDELLHHRFQLIYAFGSVQELPGGPHRWRAAQALLWVISGNRQVDEWIRRNKNFAKRTNGYLSEAFRAIEINSRPSMDYLISQFYRIVADALLTSPPYELEWMQDHTQKESIHTALIDKLAPSQALKGLSDDQYSDILILRGLLVGGILIHCLQKRHRVDFGVARPGKKKLSVPFRGADTPSLRSEFSHADCAIVFTVLAYYEDGLDEEQVASSFRTLFTLGRNVQRVIYSQWFSLSRDHINDSSLLSSLDCVEKIDMSNRAQFKHLVAFYRLNMRVINFWLNSSVFPDEMQYYPQRLSGTSWNLAENSARRTVGFSGTNDNHRLLPCQVKQFFADPHSSDPKLQSLMATNGRMLEIILNQTTKCVHLSGCEHVDKIMELLQSDPALKGAQAIIDAGALLAGQSNVKLARKIAATLKCDGVPKFKGILFFDNSSPDGQWMALEPSGRILPKNQSPVRDSDAFAIFDEPRCRGADLKLKKTATALITIGPRMCKDKFMQAAGRMRALDRGQSLVITGTDFLFEEIRETTGSKLVTPLIVLEWTLRNTVKANMEGLIPWANQGLFFSTSQGAPELSLEDEKLSLEDYYGGSFHEVSIRDAVVNARKYHNSRIGHAASRIDRNLRVLMSEIVQQANRYGENIAHSMCGMDEECERELELEREIEEEKEVEIPRMVPLKETDWDKSIVLEATALEELSEYVEIIALCDFVADQLQPHGLSLFAWSSDVFGTSNFFSTVTSQSGAPLPSSNNYLSIVDAFLAFPDNKILLISDREADELIKLFWVQSATRKDVKVALSHLSLLRSSLDGKIPDLNPDLMVLGHKWIVSQMKWWCGKEWWAQKEDRIATMQLFAGEVDYRTDSRFEALKKILRGQKVVLGPVAADPEHIVDARGNSHLFSHSELEKACRELAREAQQLIRYEENADASLPNL